MLRNTLWETVAMNNAYKLRKARDSLEEAKGLKPRFIKCPECDHKIITAYDDCIGHVTLYCNKCHAFRTINFKYFRLGSKK